ncbi:tail fiber domain-containing protein [Escherichia coli]|nr:tail fiber domain-containing protein [Escherichia coli]
MIYSTGTISINGNTATGSGTNWTAPASQVRAGQTIIVMSNPVQMFQISSVNSATSMTVTPAASPALSGQKYAILVSDIISVDGLAQAMSQLIKEYDENIGAWETFATTSANQTITVTINGTSVNIPSIGALARKGSNNDITELKGLTTALSVAQGGTGAKTEADARTKLGLGSSATKDVGTAAGNVMQVGAFGVGGPALQISSWRATEGSGFYQGDSYAPTATTYSGVKALIRDGVQFAIVGRASRAFIQTNEGGSAEGWREITTTAVSDLSLKSDVEYGDGSESLANISAMKPVTFRFTRDKSGHQRRGLIAQDLEQIDPQYIRRVNGAINEDGSLREILTLDTNPLLMDALVVLKLLIDKDNQRTSEIEALKSEIEEIRARLPPMPS